MALEVEATYENGVVKLDRPLPLKEQERVRVTIQSALTHTQRLCGMIEWRGDPAELERIALEPEFGPEECWDPSGFIDLVTVAMRAPRLKTSPPPADTTQ
jgi:predicted DNA-binding antitoxin AbrB/MazE fold protein